LHSCSATETLQGDDKFFCNACGTYQEATKRTRLVDLPDVLLLHLSRFKYTTTQDRRVTGASCAACRVRDTCCAVCNRFFAQASQSC